MTADPRIRAIHRAVLEVAGFENELAEKLEQAQQLSAAYPDALAAIQHLRPMVQAHRDRLAAYLKDFVGTELGRKTNIPQPTSKEATTLANVWRELCLAFQNCALGYAMLYEVALRLYEPRLREIAPKHMKAHAGAALSTAQMLPGVVAWQLAQDGMPCACICPMCGLGACGCVALGTQTLVEAWCGAASTESEPAGFTLQPPKPESELARAGVQGGDLLLAVDGHQVRTTDDIQHVLRSHAFGDEVRFQVQRGSESPRELVVRHISDYPKL